MHCKKCLSNRLGLKKNDEAVTSIVIEKENEPVTEKQNLTIDLESLLVCTYRNSVVLYINWFFFFAYLTLCILRTNGTTYTNKKKEAK